MFPHKSSVRLNSFYLVGTYLTSCDQDVGTKPAVKTEGFYSVSFIEVEKPR
jgi:hypothetical protein